jgi:hypothetical protein
MADEVTKKDLQNVQAVLNNKIAALEKTTNTKIQAVIDTGNKAIEALNKNIEALKKFDDDVAATVNQHAKLINELEKKCS